MHNRPIRCASESAVGSVRSLNEDAYVERSDLAFWMVADGMGGHNKGNVASQIACEDIVHSVSSGLSVPAAIQLCHQKIQLKGFQNENFRGMGTTVVCVKQIEDALEIYWVGDSRAYLFRDTQLLKLTKDHSIVQNMLESGQITQAQAHQHPKKHIITQSVGAEMITDLSIGCVTTDFNNSDRLLICSDGLHDQVSEAEIKRLFEQESDIARLAQCLVQRANELGGLDNITVLVLEMYSSTDT